MSLFPKLTVEQKVALFDAGFGPQSCGNFVSTDGGGVCKLHPRLEDSVLKFGPWTSYWNPGVYFDTVEAAVAWAAVEDWVASRNDACPGEMIWEEHDAGAWSVD